MKTIVAAASLLLTATPLAGCSSASIWARETVLGEQKRDQLVANVEKGRAEQQEAKETFATALDELLAISSGSSDRDALEAQYRAIETSFKRSETKAKAVNDRIATIDRVATKLFDEWASELDDYESESLRGQSEVQLAATKQKYEQLIGAMRRAASRMDPVLSAFRDQTLFLKHNLNAQAIASLETDLEEIRVDVSTLIKQMEAAIDEADSFIESIRGG
jgi:chromosome segregation ATPase